MATHIYTGNGKGKTTAALGLTLRAVGAGLRVYFAQFLKQGDYSEITCLRERFPEVTIAQCGSGCGFVRGEPSEQERQCAKEGFAKAREVLLSGAYDLVVLDELMVAVQLGLVTENDALALIAARPENVELVLTGRGATEKLCEAADLVSEIVCHKHYYEAGLMARKGVES